MTDYDYRQVNLKPATKKVLNRKIEAGEMRAARVIGRTKLENSQGQVTADKIILQALKQFDVTEVVEVDE